MNEIVIGSIGVGFLLLLITLGIHIALALMFTGVLGILVVSGDFGTAIGILRTTPFGAAVTWSLIVVPLFIVMGTFSLYGKITDGAFRCVKKFLGPLPGSLSIATVWACVGFGATSGSNLAAATLFTKLSLPEMKEAGYDLKSTCGLIAVSSSIAMLIPPSLYFVIYGVMTDASIAMLLISGIFPGLLVALALTTIILVRSARNPKLAPPIPEKVVLKEKLTSLLGLWPVFIIACVVLGGIYSGVFTATEAAATGAFCAFVLGLARKTLNLQGIKTSLSESAEFTAMLFFIFIGAMVFARFLAVSGFTGGLSEMIIKLKTGATGLVIGLTLLYLLLGCFMGPLEIMAITIPIFYAPLMKMGVDSIWLGDIVTLALLTGTITPPFGTAVFTVAAVAKSEVTTDDVFEGSMPYLPALLVCLALIIAFPQICLFLPRVMLSH
jgi:C4-dicarboxylate transporter DctM subunit